MILQALAEYYERKAALDPQALAPEGFEYKEIPYVLVVNADGKLVNIELTGETQGKKHIPAKYLVPQGIKKTSGIEANLLWDTAEYALGIIPNDPKKPRKPERIAEQHKAFADRITQELKHLEDEGIQAVLRFLESKNTAEHEESDDWKAIVKNNPNLTFKLLGDKGPVFARASVLQALGTSKSEANGEQALCLLTGKRAQIERLHTAIKGVWGAQTSGANIVSFNSGAFTSFGKEQGANAPVSSAAMFAYTTALNHLLRKGSTQRMQVGDATTVFWSEKASGLEESFLSFFTGDDPDARTEAIASLFNSVQNGAYTQDDGDQRFYVLGLAPNVSRIAIRFWYVSTIGELAEHIAQYFSDLEIVEPDYKNGRKTGYPSLFRLLTSVAVQGKADNIPPNLAGETMRAILEGRPLPYTLLQAAVRRCRAEHEVGYVRAALIKACLNSKRSKEHKEHKNPHLKLFTMALDPENNNPGYRLGRLFAVLERVQEKAINPSATIRDRYYGAASSTPASVFPQLMRLKNHHLAKLENPKYYERMIGEVVDGLQAHFPKQLDLNDQGAFAIGYYHQRQDFFKSRTPQTQSLCN